jgi:hypothetical protein
MKMKLAVAVFLAATLVSAAGPLFAHHGNASYDTSKLVTVDGVVTQYTWANPHVFLRVDAKDESGNVVHWVLEAQNAVTQAGAGWTREMFKPGDHVSVEATPAKNGRSIGRFNGKIVINGQLFKRPE